MDLGIPPLCSASVPPSLPPWNTLEEQRQNRGRAEIEIKLPQLNPKP